MSALPHSASAPQPETPDTLPITDPRAAPRYTMLIRSAKLCGPLGEFLCIVRDASDSGVSVRLFHPLPHEHELALELQNGDLYAVALVWEEADRAGFKFLTAVDIARIIECPSQFAKRPVRINLYASARLECAGMSAEVELHDLSQQGARITTTARFAIDQRVRLTAKGLPEVNAKVRWRRGDTYGLVFEDTFQFGDMARIVAGLQLGGIPQFGA